MLGWRAVVTLLMLHATDALVVRGPLPRFPTVCDRHPTMCSDREDPSSGREGPTKRQSLLGRLTAFADASWDLFVMPGEYANSRYDRELPPMEDASEQRSAFNWAGDSQEEEALRLPTGIPAAERLASERGTPLPDQKRSVSQVWIAAPSLVLLLCFAGFLLGQQPSDPAPGLMESRAERRVSTSENEWIRERIAQREAAMETSQP